MLTKKRKIIISVIVIGIGFIMAILYFANKSKNKSAEISSEKNKITPSITRPLKFPQGKISVEIQKNNKHKESGKSTTSPVVVVKPFSQKPYFDNKNKLELEQNKDKKTNKPKNKVVLSEKEIFEKLYPSSFRDILLELQDFMISEGVIEERERVNFQTEDEIMDFAKKAIKFFEQKKVISSEDAKRFIEIGIPQWRKIKHQEAENLRQGKPQGVIGFYKKVLNNSICQQSQRSFNLSENIDLSLLRENYGTHIKDRKGNYLFTLIPSNSSVTEKPFFYISVSFYLVALVFFLYFVNSLIKKLFFFNSSVRIFVNLFLEISHSFALKEHLYFL